MQPCSNPYGPNHTVVGYRTADLVHWEYTGVALPMRARSAGIEFRPCVVYNARTRLFVMWYEDRGPGEAGYAVATSPTPAGPFQTARTNVVMPGRGRTGDFNLFVDDDGAAYHVRTGFDVVRLDDAYTGPAQHVSSFSTPRASEGPSLFKRAGVYYVIAGTGCCACIGGSSMYVLSSPSIAGPWRYQGDVGSVPNHTFDPHSPHNYVTRAQGSAVFPAGDDFVYLGNQWNTGPSRNHDLLFFGLLQFAPAPRVQCVDELQAHKGGRAVTLACAAGTINAVLFGAFGTPEGSCDDPTALRHSAACDASNATTLISSLCLGKPSCTISPDVHTFGDPCVGTVKRLLAAVNCSQQGASDTIQQMVWRDEVQVES